ncbi:MAG: Holliday junction ATP-dependent DNA helicase RuvA [Candidatus Wallbacteria bacterium]|nr:Holliday junction ATP-dependent DNA helicase RuvA [Candidatus Wallbacteria bacterium]
MLRYVRGIIRKKENGKLLLEAGGFGLLLHFPVSSMDQVGREGEEATVFTEMILRARESDGEIELFGFAEEDDLRLFRTLLTVSKIGPKLAMAVLSQLPRQAIVSAIINSEWRTLSRVSGLGEKTSQRIVVELRDKVAKEFSVAATGTADIGVLPDKDLQEAMKTLGYNSKEIRRGMSLMPSDFNSRPLEDRIRLLLGALAR